MGLTSAVHWWEESQLRVLVLSSLIVQWILFISSLGRRFTIPWWFRSLIWLAYLGSDAVAIYALATLFNRHKNQVEGGSVLEVVWAPVLLMHLGGQYTITAYNIEDNELWKRHVLTVVSQVIVAIYVFCKSWKGGDKRLLQAAILMFVPGVLKCFVKPWALNSASINSLVSSPKQAQRTTANKNKVCEITPLMSYVQEATEFVQHVAKPPVQEEGNTSSKSKDQAQVARGFVHSDHPPVQEEGHISSEPQDHAQAATRKRESFWERVTRKWKSISWNYLVQGRRPVPGEPDKLFVDLAYPYSDRLATLKYFWELKEEKALFRLRVDLSYMFGLLYTRLVFVPSTFGDLQFRRRMRTEVDRNNGGGLLITLLKALCNYCIWWVCVTLPLAAIGLLRYSHREDYNAVDVKITYALFCFTVVIEFYFPFLQAILWNQWPDETVSQYSLIGYSVRNKKHAKWMRVIKFFRCKDYIDQILCTESCSSSPLIMKLVLQYVKEEGWKKCIKNAASYRKFNDHKGQWTLECYKCSQDICWSLQRPFDESVLIWHIATDICFFYPDVSHPQGALCREMSNYMMYLLFVNPEMLLPGSRRNLLTTAYDELGGILKDDKPPLEESKVMKRVITKLKSEQDPQEDFIHDAWALAQGLLALRDDEKMWKVIEGVWVEMLCFSAGRCRGYLHAKALGAGAELLTYVWLLLSYMGMETLTERLQRQELPRGGDTGAAPSTPEVHNGATSSTSEIPAAPSTPETPTNTTPSTLEVPTDTAPSSLEIRIAIGK